MKILCTFPGRHGDLLWALPTVRAIAETVGQQVDFATTGKYGRIAPLVKAQDYIGAVMVLKSWEVEEGAPMRPVVPQVYQVELPSEYYDKVIHLGYPGWPEAPLPFYVEKIGRLQMRDMVAIDLTRPWIDGGKPAKSISTTVAVGFSDEHFELKYGIWSLLSMGRLAPFASTHGASWIPVMGAPGSRWMTEAGERECSWELAAHILVNCKLFLGCCSSLHVLACAMGKPVLIMEPNEQRWNPVFYPYGMDGPRVKVIRGGDGKPTFDARHVRDEIHALLQ